LLSHSLHHTHYLQDCSKIVVQRPKHLGIQNKKGHILALQYAARWHILWKMTDTIHPE
jgi:hypothetical protein